VVQIASGFAEEGGRSPIVSVGGRELALLEVMEAAEEMLWGINWAIQRS
jgi:hypothetical protein